MTSAMSKKMPPSGKENGFTLIELLIVITIIGILATIAAPSYRQHIIKAREAVLLEDLFQMRHSIDAFFADNDRYPMSLAELVDKKYLRSIPRDPFTRESDSWILVQADPLSDFDAAREGIFDVHSGSQLVGLNEIPYQEW